MCKKICKECKIEKDCDDFHRMKKGLNGRRTICKECRKKEKDEYLSRPEVIERNKKYYQEHKHEMRERLNVYYWSLVSQYHQYLKMAKKKNRSFLLTKDDCNNFFNTKCYYCGDDYKGLRMDRIDSNKGYEIDNVRPCCWSCNYMKNSLNENEFYDKIKKIINHLKL
jgi:hypothetical protein